MFPMMPGLSSIRTSPRASACVNSQSASATATEMTRRY